MDENNKSVNEKSVPVASEKKAKNKKSNTQKFSFNSWLAEHKAEFKKIIWPSRKELIKQTVTVIFVSLVVGAIIFCMDEVVSFIYNSIINALAA